MFKIVTICLAATMLTGCFGLTNVKVDPMAYQPVKIAMVDNPPSKSMLAGGKPRVVVFPTEEKAELAAKYGISEAKTTAIEKFVARSAEIVDRSLAEKFKDEISLSEIKGNPWGGPEIADYAVTSVISHAKWSNKYSAARSYINKKGKRINIAASCRYTANVSGAIKVFELPSMTLAGRVDVTGSVSSSEDAGSRYSSGKCTLEDSELSGLLSKAGINSVEAHRVQLQNLFAPKGYITERRTSEKSDIFRVSLGSKRGAVAGNKVSISRTQTSNSQLGGAYTEVVRLGEAKIAEPVEEKYSWLYVDKPELADKLKIGDSIQMIYKAGMLESVNSFIKK